MLALGRPIGMRRLGTLAAAASIALIAACGGNDNEGDTAVPEGDSGAPATETTAPIVGNRWVLAEADTASASIQAAEEYEAYLQIDESGEVNGSTGCNGFGGTAQVGEGSVTFERVLATKRACSGPPGDIDSAMLTVLRGEVSTEVTGDTLTLVNEEGETLTLHAADEPASEL